MKQKFKSVEEKMNKLFQKFAPVKEKAEVFLSKLPKRKPHSEKYYKRIAFFNKYSLIFHFILACFITFTVEVISRRDFFLCCFLRRQSYMGLPLQCLYCICFLINCLPV